MSKTDSEKLLQTVELLREEVKKAVPDQEKMAEMHKDIEKHEESNQQLVLANTEAKQKQVELEEKLQGLEVEIARGSNVTGNQKSYKDSHEYKAMHAFVVGGEKGMMKLEAEVKEALRTDVDSQGGYLVSQEMDTTIVKKITEISAIRAIARVRTINSKTLNMPVRASIPEADYEGEGETGGTSTAKYENETITPFRLTFTTPITMDMLMDAAFNMESELFSDAAEAFAFKEGLKFVLGSGHKQPHGFLADSRVTDNFRTSVSSGELRAEDLLKVTGDLKTGYDPTFVMNRRTLATLRTEKSTTGQFIWQPGINGVVMNTLAGEPYVIANDMPDISTGAFAVAYGDFMRGYTIVDRTGMSVIRDDYTAKKQAIVEYTMHKWNTGRVTLPEALTGIKIKA